MSIPAAYLTVILIWSTTPLAIKWSAQGGTFSFAVASRMAIGLVVAGLVIAIWRVGLPLHRRARTSYLVGGLSLFGAMTLTYWGSQYIHSGLVSVLFGLSPLVTGVLALLWLKEEALAPKKLLGMMFGLAGLAVIFGDAGAMGGSHAVAGVAALLGAVLVYSSGMVWIKRIGDDSPPLATTAGTLAGGKRTGISRPPFRYAPRSPSSISACSGRCLASRSTTTSSSTWRRARSRSSPWSRPSSRCYWAVRSTTRRSVCGSGSAWLSLDSA